MFTVESFGGPDRFTREVGCLHLIDVHRYLKITEEQRQRFVELYLAGLDAVDIPDDEPFRDAVRAHVELGSQLAMQNSKRLQRGGAASFTRGADLDLERRQMRGCSP